MALKIKKELLFDNKCRVLDAMNEVANKLTNTLHCTSQYSELCAFYLNLDNTLEQINRELSILECPLDSVPEMKPEEIPNV